jgi:esterase/lipase superfamily enzyme
MTFARIVCVVMLVVTTACAPRGTITIAPEAAEVGTVRPIFLATSRGVTDLPDRFGSERGPLSFARYDVSVPPQRKEGSIPFPGRDKIDPTRQMLTVDERVYANEGQFQTALATALQGSTSARRVIVFVHGFNNTYAEGIYRAAQLAHDLNVTSTVVHFSWPSSANAFGYVHDRDSTLYSRDPLQDLLDDIAKAGASEIVLVAHSMGALLSMETLRQMAIGGDTATMRKLSAVILISPDIDVDVFRSQMSAIPHPPQPLVIFGSPRDLMLKVSATITGASERLGNLKDGTPLADLPVTYVDVGAFRDGDGHFSFATSPELLAVIQQLTLAQGWLAAEGRRTDDPITGILLRTQDASRVILAPLRVLKRN